MCYRSRVDRKPQNKTQDKETNGCVICNAAVENAGQNANMTEVIPHFLNLHLNKKNTELAEDICRFFRIFYTLKKTLISAFAQYDICSKHGQSTKDIVGVIGGRINYAYQSAKCNSYCPTGSIAMTIFNSP